MAKNWKPGSQSLFSNLVRKWGQVSDFLIACFCHSAKLNNWISNLNQKPEAPALFKSGDAEKTFLLPGNGKILWGRWAQMATWGGEGPQNVKCSGRWCDTQTKPDWSGRGGGRVLAQCGITPSLTACRNQPFPLLHPHPQEDVPRSLGREVAFVQFFFSVSLATVQHLEAPEVRWRGWVWTTNADGGPM